MPHCIFYDTGNKCLNYAHVNGEGMCRKCYFKVSGDYPPSMTRDQAEERKIQPKPKPKRVRAKPTRVHTMGPTGWHASALRQERVIELAREGLRDVDIAAIVECPVGTVSSIVTRARKQGTDIPHRPKGRRPAPEGTAKIGSLRAANRRASMEMRAQSEETHAYIIALAREGLRDIEIAQMVDRAVGTVSSVITRARKSGMDIPHRPKGRRAGYRLTDQEKIARAIARGETEEQARARVSRLSVWATGARALSSDEQEAARVSRAEAERQDEEERKEWRKHQREERARAKEAARVARKKLITLSEARQPKDILQPGRTWDDFEDHEPEDAPLDYDPWVEAGGDPLT